MTNLHAEQKYNADCHNVKCLTNYKTTDYENKKRADMDIVGCDCAFMLLAPYIVRLNTCILGC